MRAGARLLYAAVWAAWLWGHVTAETIRAEDGGETDKLRFVATTYLANRESFRFFDMQWEVRAGLSSSPDAALRQGPADEIVSGKARWVQRDRIFLFTLESDDRLRGGTAKSAYALLPPEVVISDGKHTLSLSGFMGGGTLHSDRLAYVGLISTPWDMAGMLGPNEVMTPGRVILDYLAAAPKGIRLVHGGTNGPSPQGLRVELERGAYTYSLDSAHGYIPLDVRYTLADGTLVQQAVTTRIATDPQGRHYPERVVSMWLMPGGGVRVKEINVTRLAATKPPDDALFSFVAQDDLQVNDGVSKAVVIRTGRRVHASELPNLLKEIQTNPQIQVQDSLARQETSRRGWVSWVLAAAGVVLVALFVAYRIYRRHPATRSSSPNMTEPSE